MKLLILKYPEYHVSLDTVKEFEQAILNYSDDKIHYSTQSLFSIKLFTVIHHVSRKLNITTLVFWFFKIVSSFFTREQITILMGTNITQCLPHFFSNGKKHIYLFDAWINSHQNIIKLAKELVINNIFVSSSQAAIELQKYNSRCKFHWVPEGINLQEYQFLPYAKRDIDILELGRKYDLYHEKIVTRLNEMNKIHLYEKIKGEILFPSRKKFIEGLSRTKISICFPSNITHPERAGNIETMTIRYLQSMASKCLIVGKAPEEMIQVFGYNPVITADMDNPAEQLDIILKNFNLYEDLIEKNYENVANHTWSKRWEQIMLVLNSKVLQ